MNTYVSHIIQNGELISEKLDRTGYYIYYFCQMNYNTYIHQIMENFCVYMNYFHENFDKLEKELLQLKINKSDDILPNQKCIKFNFIFQHSNKNYGNEICIEFKITTQ